MEGILFPIIFGVAGMIFVLVILGYIVILIKAMAKTKEENSFKDLAKELSITNKKLLEKQDELMERVNYIEGKIREVE